MRSSSLAAGSDISTTTAYLGLNGTGSAATCFDNSTAAALGFGGTAPRYVGCRTSAPGDVREIAYWNSAANDSFKNVTVRYWDSTAFVTHWTYTGANMTANSSRIDTKPWITHRARFDELPAVFPSYTKPETGVIKAMIEVD